MIQHLHIENFKSIRFAEIETGNLNLFTGVNGSGKSSILQTLILIRQSFLAGGLFTKPYSLQLNNADGLISLGTFKDILCYQASRGEESVKININFSGKTLEIKSDLYDVKNRDSNTLQIELNQAFSDFHTENLFTSRFQYLAAERIEPNEEYPRFNQVNELLGKKGEYTAHYLEKHGMKDVPIPALSLRPEPASITLINLVNDWMGEISNSIEVIAKENLKTNKIELSYRYKREDGTPTQDQKPQNVGFGVTHTLPIVVALLSAQKGDIILIENPESHLHPKGQSRLAFLIAKAAENGIQLFIETHSDHIINGLRVAVKKQTISKDNVYLNYISKNKQDLSEISRLNVQAGGGLNEWPEGFFDEWDNLLNELL